MRLAVVVALLVSLSAWPWVAAVLLVVGAVAGVFWGRAQKQLRDDNTAA